MICEIIEILLLTIIKFAVCEKFLFKPNKERKHSQQFSLFEVEPPHGRNQSVNQDGPLLLAKSRLRDAVKRQMQHGNDE